MTSKTLILLLSVALLASGCDELGDVFAGEPSASAAESVITDEPELPPAAAELADPETSVEAPAPADEPAAITSRVENVIGPCQTIVAPDRFGASWKRLNHRIAAFEARLVELDDCDASAAHLGLRGGAFANGKFFNDDAKATFAARRIRTEQIRGARFTVATTFENGLAVETVHVSREALGLDDAENIVAMIGGVKFDTGVEQTESFRQTGYDADLGFTLRGFGAGARVRSANADEIVVEYRLQFEPGAAPDRGRHNRAIRYARIRGELDVVLLAVADVPVRIVNHGYSMFYERPGLGNIDQPVPNGSKVSVEAEGTAGEPRGFAGIGDFRFDLKFGKKCSVDSECPDGSCVASHKRCAGEFGLAGDYLQALSVSVGVRGFNPANGRAVLEATGYASNSSDSIAFRPLAYDFSTRLVWVQTDGVWPIGPLDGALQKGEVTLPFAAPSGAQ